MNTKTEPIRLAVNGAPREIAAATSDQLRSEIERQLPAGHVICTLQVNGHCVPLERLEEFAPQAVRELSIESALPAELARGAVPETQEWIGRICGALDQVSREYRLGRDKEGASQLIEVIDALQVLVHLIDGIGRHLDVTPDVRERIGTRWAAAQAELSRTVSDLATDLSSGDPVRLADQTGYLLPRCLNGFQKLLGEVEA